MKPKYRLDVLGSRWDTLYLGVSPSRLEQVGYDLLQPSGPFRAYRVRKARKEDTKLLEEGLYKPVSTGLYVWYEWGR